MSYYISGKTANEVWKSAASLLLNHDSLTIGRSGEVYELLHTFISIDDPKQKWIYDRIPPLSIAFALAEIVWIMNGEDRSDIINVWNPKLEKFAGNGSIYHGAYGKRIRSHFGFDQLEKAFYALNNVPESRQVVIQIFDTKIDFPIDNGHPRNDDIPCNICSMLKVRNRKLEWTQIMRSNDVLLGMPYNFVQFTSLQEILAGWLKLDIGSYNHFSDSLHLYIRDESILRLGQENETINKDSLALCKEESEIIFNNIYERMIALTKNEISEDQIFLLASLDSVHVAYNNIMMVIAAYIAHKHNFLNLTEKLIDKCTNNVYKMMWNKWTNRNNVSE